MISGILIFLSFPETNTFYTAFIFLIPLLIIIENEKSYKKIFLYGFIMQITTITGGFYWLIKTISLHGHLNLTISFFVFILYAAFFGLRFPLFMILSKFLIKKTNISKFIIYPFTFTIIEFIFPDLFPWFVANSQHNNIYFIQIADITGVYGITFLIILINTFIYNILLNIKKIKNISPYAIISTLSLILIFYIYGFLRYNYIKNIEKNIKPIKIGLIQPVTPLLILDRIKEKQNTIKKLFTLSEEILIKHKIDILIWPESSSDVIFRSNRDKDNFNIPLINLVKNYSIYLMISDMELVYEAKDKNNNIIEIDPFNKEGLINLKNLTDLKRKLYSTAVLLNKEGNIIGNYRKVYPLPFAEYMPLGETFPFLKRLFAEVGNFSAGKEITLFETEYGKFAPSICYELIIPSFTRKFIKKGGIAILNQTNDGWFGKTKASRQHLALSLFRSIENRVPIVRSTNSGISTFISATGDFTTRLTNLGEITTLYGEIRPVKIYSFYAYAGNIFTFLLIIIFCIIIFYNFLKQDRKKKFIYFDEKL